MNKNNVLNNDVFWSPFFLISLFHMVENLEIKKHYVRIRKITTVKFDSFLNGCNSMNTHQNKKEAT